MPLKEPLELTSLTYRHSGMSIADSYSMMLEKTEGGTHVVLELNSGIHTADVILQEDLLAELSRVATEYRMDAWDGFDKVNKHVLDGESFEIRMVLGDGRLLRAHGSNAYPKGYQEAVLYIEQVLNDLTVRLTDLYPKTIESENIVYMSFVRSGAPHNESEVKLTCERLEDGTLQLLGRIRSREDLSEQDVEVYTECEAFPFEEVENILSTYHCLKYNGWEQKAADNEFASIYVRYDTGEVLEVCGTTLPDGFEACISELEEIMADCIRNAVQEQ